MISGSVNFKLNADLRKRYWIFPGTVLPMDNIKKVKKVEIGEIIAYVCSFYNVKDSEVLTISRSRLSPDAIKIRHLICFFGRKYTKSKWRDISELTNKSSHHATAILGYRATKNRLDVDKKFREEVHLLENYLLEKMGNRAKVRLA